MWGSKEVEQKSEDGKVVGSYFELFAIKQTDSKGKAALSGDIITDARKDYDQRQGGVPLISMSMNSEAAQKWNYRFLWDSPVQIASCNCDHSGLCNPGRQNRTMVASRAGKYIEKIPNQALYTLCNYLEGQGKLSSSLIKSVMEPVCCGLPLLRPRI